jgi:transposase-like protein
MANKKLLAATLAESLASKQPFLSLLSAQQNPADRPSPPSSRPVRSSELPPPLTRSHTLPRPEGPDRSLIDNSPSPVEPEPVATKKAKRTRRKFSEGEKRAIVTRVLDGGERPVGVASELSLQSSTMSRWLAAERQRRAYAERGKKRSATVAAKKALAAPAPEPTLMSAPSAPARPEPVAVTGPLHSFEDWLRVVVRAEVRAALREALAGGLGK